MAKIYGQLERAQLENKSSDYAATIVGALWWRTDTGKFKIGDGTNVREIPVFKSTSTLPLLTLASEPAGAAGEIFYDTAVGALKVHSGTTWSSLASFTVDNSSIQQVTGQLSIKAGGVAGSHLASGIVDNSSIEISSNTLRVKAGGVTHAMLAARATGTSVAADGVALSPAGTSLFTTTSTSLVDVTSVTCTIVASGNRPIWIGLVGESGNSYLGIEFTSAASGPVEGYFVIMEGATTIAFTTLAGYLVYPAQLEVPCGGFSAIISSPSAGSHTYKLQTRISSGHRMRCSNVRLVAFEL